MKSLIVPKIAAALAAVAVATGLAACGGRGLAPSPLGQSDAAQRSPQAASPCRISGYYYLHGPCMSLALTPNGGTYHLAAYRGFRLSIGIPKNGGGGKIKLTFGDATGDGDITGTAKGKKFSPYPKPCGGNACPGTPFLYFVLDPTAVLKLNGKTTFTVVNAAAYPGKNCIISYFNIGRWFVLTAPVKPKGSTLTFSVADSEFLAAPVVSGIACS